MATYTSQPTTMGTALNLGADLTGPQRDAFAALKAIFNEYGLGTLAPRIADFLKQGYSPDTISLLLRETPEYKTRFAANDARAKAGLPTLSPAEYIATERSYRQIMQAAGLPSGFYDSTQDFQKFLEMDVSPQEIQDRVTAASNFVDKATPEDKALFSQWYTKGDMIAFALDPNRAAPLVGKAFAAAQIGGQAAAHSFGLTKDYAERLANTGLTEDQASQGFGAIQATIGNDQKLAALSGTTLTAEELMNETFFNDAATTLKRQKLSAQEEARFGGASAVGGSTLGTSNAGQL